MKNDHLVLQIVCFCFTLALLAISFFAFKDDVKADIVLIIVGVLELIGIIITLLQRRK